MINRYITKDGKKLRYGYTTGSCAAAGAKACAIALLLREEPTFVTIDTPKGVELTIPIESLSVTSNTATTSVKKDSGDDPDATKDMLIFSKVELTEEKGIFIDGGEGIGRVTKEGLDQKIGEAAINSVPRIMIAKELIKVMEKTGYNGGFSVIISAPEGEEVATHTFNSRLGIIGGISILGTTGIVEPMSENAIIDTIKAELSVSRAGGRKTVIITPGNYGADFLCKEYSLHSEDWVKTSNFIGETLDYAIEIGFEQILIVGHIGKLIKLAGGMFNTHSKYGDCRGEIMASHLLLQGGTRENALRILSCATTEDMVDIISDIGCKDEVLESILKKTEANINYRLKGKAQVGVVMFSHKNGLLSKSINFDEIINSVV